MDARRNLVDPTVLKPGDPHYRAYVGPPAQYDFMGATQFRLLCTLGLRGGHALLDLGCGSLRAGRLFIPYLDAGRYFGIEPNTWLIDDAIANELGRDVLAIKRPTFDHNELFDTSVFGRRFDYIVAQSIFSHAGADLVRRVLVNLRDSVEPEGLIALTFVEGADDFDGSGWVYPDSVHYRPSTIAGFFAAADLPSIRIPWYHPRQQWYVAARNSDRLPIAAQMPFLRGAVLGDADLRDSWDERRSTKA